MRSRRVIETAGQTVAQQIESRVLAQLRGKVKGEVMASAILRAERIIREEPHTPIGKAVQRGIVFAVCEDEPNPPPPPRAA